MSDLSKSGAIKNVRFEQVFVRFEQVRSPEQRLNLQQKKKDSGIMERKKEKHEKKIDKALHLAEERLELLDTIKEMVETEVDKQMKKVCRRVKSEK